MIIEHHGFKGVELKKIEVGSGFRARSGGENIYIRVELADHIKVNPADDCVEIPILCLNDSRMTSWNDNVEVVPVDIDAVVVREKTDEG